LPFLRMVVGGVCGVGLMSRQSVEFVKDTLGSASGWLIWSLCGRRAVRMCRCGCEGFAM